MQAEQQSEREAVCARITAYLSGGGLFNPEFANHTAVRDLLIDCRAALSHSSTPQGWKPMESAPKDGTEVLLYCPTLDNWQRWLTGKIVVGAFMEDKWFSDAACELDSGYESTGAFLTHEPVHPTRWMPLPPPPEQGGKG